MKIYDISQELTGCTIFPGDAKPETQMVNSMEKGDLYNLTNISLCVHNGTHIDAPFHFIKNGKTVNEIPPEKFMGNCLVISHTGSFTADNAKKYSHIKRLLIKGNAVVSSDAARVFANEGMYLIGNESQTIGPEDTPMEVHKILLEKEVILLEGIRLADVPDGEYFLCAQPINIANSDGAPVRAMLIEF